MKVRMKLEDGSKLSSQWYELSDPEFVNNMMNYLVKNRYKGAHFDETLPIRLQFTEETGKCF